MGGIVNAVLRGTALLWTLLITALCGNALASNIRGPVATLNWTMFVVAWSWVASLYGLAAVFFSVLAVPVILLALDGMATLLTFIDSIVLSARLMAVNCSSPGRRGRDWIGYGSNDTEKRCREIQASIVFMWFLWVTYCAILFFVIKDWRGGGLWRRSPKPSMSQVGV